MLAFGPSWGVITRRAVVQLCQTPWSQSTATYTDRRYFWYFLTPLYPLVYRGIPIAQACR
jgi:hypothetical protein